MVELTVEANGIRFHCLEAGSGPLVLCLHGFPDTPRTWDLLLPALAKAGYRAVAPSLRGYAPSTRPADGDYSVRALAADVLALIAALGAERAILVGHDWGALAAYAAASAAPEKIEKLVTIAIPHPLAIDALSVRFFTRSWHFFYYGLIPLLPGALLARSSGWGSVPWIYGRWSPGWTPPEDELAAVRRSFEGGVDGPIGYYRSFAKDQLLGRLGLIFEKTSVPTLTILGRRDGALGLKDPEKTRSAFTGSYQLELLDCGHFVPRERPEAVEALVLAFLAATPQRAEGAAATGSG